MILLIEIIIGIFMGLFLSCSLVKIENISLFSVLGIVCGFYFSIPFLLNLSSGISFGVLLFEILNIKWNIRIKLMKGGENKNG